MKKLALFSSDSASLYKKDVFRIMGLQNDFVIHFRYGLEHLALSLPELKKHINETALIFFTYGNDLTKDISLRTVTNVPLREAEVVDIIETQDTGLVHIYLKLKDYIKCDIQFLAPTHQTPNKWASEVNVNNLTQSSWHERLSSIKSQFSDQLFYKIDILDDKSQRYISPYFSKEQSSSYYELKDESSYLLSIAFFDTSATASDSSQQLKISTKDSEAIRLNAPEILDIGARRDNRKYSLFTQAITSKNGYSYLIFESVETSSTGSLKNYIQVPFQIKKNSRRAFWFALYTVLAAISVGYSKLITDKWDLYGSFNWFLFFNCVAAFSFGFFSFFKLYQLYNKK